MTSTEAVRAAIGAKMLTVAEIGRVHPYERYAKDTAGFQSLYGWRAEGATVDEIRGWFIHRRACREYERTRSTCRVETDWMIRGYLGLQDARATALIMDALVSRLQDAFRQDPTLGGVVERPRAQTEVPVGLQMAESAPYMFAGILSHGVTLTLMTTHYAPGYPATDALDDLKIIHANWELPPRALTGPALPDDDDAVASDHLSNLDEDRP